LERSFSGVFSERRPKRSAWSCRFSPSSCSTFCSNAAMRFRASRWRLCQYPTCWRNSRFSRRKRSTSARNSTTSRLEFSTGSINSGEEPLEQQTCTNWPIMTTLVYRDGRDLGRGEFSFIHYKQTCTDGIGEALRRNRRKLLLSINLRRKPGSPNFCRKRKTIMDWSPRSRTSNPRSRSPAVIPRHLDYG